MSTSSDSSSEEEREHSDFIEEEPATPDAGQPIKQPEEHAQPAPVISTLPPEAQGEANGGPLGCCLGIVVGLLLSLSIAVLSRFYADPLAQVFSSWLSLIVRIVMIFIALVAICVCGYFGWKIGRNAYREYDPPVVKDRRGKKIRPQSRS